MFYSYRYNLGTSASGTVAVQAVSIVMAYLQVASTSDLGDESIITNNNLLLHLAATSALGSVTTAASRCRCNRIIKQQQVYGVNVWGLVDTSQTPNYSTISTSQTPNWSEVA